MERCVRARGQDRTRVGEGAMMLINVIPGCYRGTFAFYVHYFFINSYSTFAKSFEVSIDLLSVCDSLLHISAFCYNNFTLTMNKVTVKFFLIGCYWLLESQITVATKSIFYTICAICVTSIQYNIQSFEFESIYQLVDYLRSLRKMHTLQRVPAYRLSLSRLCTKYVHLLQNIWALQRARAFVSTLESIKPLPRLHEICTFISLSIIDGNISDKKVVEKSDNQLFPPYYLSLIYRVLNYYY